MRLYLCRWILLSVSGRLGLLLVDISLMCGTSRMARCLIIMFDVFTSIPPSILARALHPKTMSWTFAVLLSGYVFLIEPFIKISQYDCVVMLPVRLPLIPREEFFCIVMLPITWPEVVNFDDSFMWMSAQTLDTFTRLTVSLIVSLLP